MYQPRAGEGTEVRQKHQVEAGGAEVIAPVPIDGNCKKASYDFCCAGWIVGKPCDCTKGSSAPDQCKPESYVFCCNVGTPCDCTKPGLRTFAATLTKPR